MLSALRWWLTLGCISFGGPAGQIAILHRELVERRKWIGERRFLHALNYCMVLPGPEAQQLATYIGWLMHGTWGGVAAGALFVLPSLVLLIGLSWLYVAFGTVPVVAAVLAGVKPGVVAVVIGAAWRIARRALRGRFLPSVTALSLLAAFVAPFPLIVASAALLGWIFRRSIPPHAPHASNAQSMPAFLGDDDPPPTHAAPSFRRTLLTTAVAALLGVGGYFILDHLADGGAGPSGEGTLRDMAAFFTSAALLTFGGAYAVIPYVFHGAVDVHHWLDAPQMLDGLALGESTPGPLIMIVAFVGYLGGVGAGSGWNDGFAAGMAGACVATFYTFLPSFLFILVGGPLVERTRTIPAVTAPLTAITAAVVGLILHLAFFLARHAIIDVPSGILALAAGVALMRFDVPIPRVLASCALVGILRHYVGFG